MTSFTATVPCEVTYRWNPKIAATEDEPASEEEFEIDNLVIDGHDVTYCVDSYVTNVVIYEYLKGMRDEQ